jgi:hypothetical protein
MTLAMGSHLSARQGENRDTVSGKTRWAAGCFSDLGRNGSRGHFLFLFPFLFLFFFYFLICFITLTFGYQMHSSKFLNFCKIQHYILKQ